MDTKGQTCYICTQALHWKTKEGLVRGCSCRGTAGFAHVSCLAEQAKILVAEAEEYNKPKNPAWRRWDTCSLCEQQYHGVVRCALGWACWKTYLGLPEAGSEASVLRVGAINLLGNGLHTGKHYEDALSVQEAELSMLRRLGVPENNILIAQNNLASTYKQLGRSEEALRIERDVYFGWLKLNGEEHENTLLAALNYTNSLSKLERFKEAKSLLRRTMPVARRALGEGHRLTLKIRWNYAQTLCYDPSSTLDELHEGVSTLEDTTRTARQVLGGAHPLTVGIERGLGNARAALTAREPKK